MKRYLIPVTFFLAAIMSGCGGGGGGSSAPASKAVTTVYLFGNMTTSAWVATVDTSFKLPNGVLANVSTASGVTSGNLPLYSASFVPSGPVVLPASNFSGTYNTSTGLVRVSMINNGGLNVRMNSVGNGIEIGKIIFKLPTAGSTPTLPSTWVVPNPTDSSEYLKIGQDTPSHDTSYVPNCKLNFVTTFQ
ncbi:hypothetical protein [Geomesophilobacter sediminis]|uniref:Lipoprotein n=1 Tax=Geomesophilobacter sediminis TaxID=2798584 RepID=A0A8J7SD72_9BACT|nr:hypothetical protein [Geomesophilobacter sediminis]MBJ6727649.1 hypothetical protein [Geomesophilobacter sediminis]